MTEEIQKIIDQIHSKSKALHKVVLEERDKNGHLNSEIERLNKLLDEKNEEVFSLKKIGECQRWIPASLSDAAPVERLMLPCQIRKGRRTSLNVAVRRVLNRIGSQRHQHQHHHPRLRFAEKPWALLKSQ